MDDDHSGSISWKLRAILIFLLVWQFNFGISDAAVVAIVCFLYKVFTFMHVKFDEQTKQPADEQFPRTLKKASQLVGINMNCFIEYIVCPKCNAVYDHEFGYTMQDNQKVPVECPNIEYPHHPHLSRRKPCGLSLMKIAKTRTGKTTVKPYKVFAYQPLENAITNLVNRNGFLNACEQWRTRSQSIPVGILGDIYDGKVWQEFKTVDGSKFLESSFNICFTLNVDWFQPFTRTRKLSFCIVFVSND